MGCFVMEGWSLEMEVYVIRDSWCWDCCYEFFMCAGRYPGGGERARIIIEISPHGSILGGNVQWLADSIWVISFFLFPLSFRHYPIILKKSDRLWQVVPAAEEHPHFTSWKIFLGNIFLPNWYLLNILPEMIFRTLIFLPQAEFQYKPSFAPTRFTGKWNV